VADVTEYWRPIAQGIDVEDRRVRLYVRHKLSLGIAREAILREVLINQTPEPLRVKTGFVVDAYPKLVTSNQCDILVYDPSVSQPLYKIDEFVVVPFHATRIIAEVRSTMGITSSTKSIGGLDQVFKVWQSTKQLPVAPPTFGFGYKGVTFDNFVSAMAARVNNDIMNVPECIAVHKMNYLCIRVTRRNVGADPRLTAPKVCVAFDFSQSDKDTEGFATALFLEYYNLIVHPRRHHDVITIENTRDYSIQSGLPVGGIRIIHEDGTVAQGPIPANL